MTMAGPVGGVIGQIEVHIIAKVEAEIVQGVGAEDRPERYLEEVARSAVGQRKSITGGSGRIEIAVRTSIALVVVSGVEGVFAADYGVEL